MNVTFSKLLLTTIPGVSVLSAEIILAKIGRDMSRFPTAGHLISWAGLCPKNDESAGKRRSTRMRKGALGSRPPWFNAPGPPLAERPVISRRSFTAQPVSLGYLVDHLASQAARSRRASGRSRRS